jgi:hypothetical protein
MPLVADLEAPVAPPATAQSPSGGGLAEPRTRSRDGVRYPSVPVQLGADWGASLGA